MSVEGALYSRLTTQTAVTTIAGTRTYAVQLPPAATYPAVSFQRISDVREHTMGADPGVAAVRFQVDCWAETYDTVRDLAEGVSTACSRFRGTVDSTEVLDIFIENETDIFDAEEKVYRAIMDLIVFHRE